MAQPPFGSFVNFVAAGRKSALIPSMYFSPNQQIDWIWGAPASGLPGGTVTPVTVGASPFTYTPTNGTFVYISGGPVTSIVQGSQSLTTALPITVWVPAGGSLVITFPDPLNPPILEAQT